MLDREMIVSHITLRNKSGKKIRAEVTYNSNMQELMVTIIDRVDTVYVDVNPNKNVSLPSKWIQNEVATPEPETNTKAET